MHGCQGGGRWDVVSLHACTKQVDVQHSCAVRPTKLFSEGLHRRRLQRWIKRYTMCKRSTAMLSLVHEACHLFALPKRLRPSDHCKLISKAQLHLCVKSLLIRMSVGAI